MSRAYYNRTTYVHSPEAAKQWLMNETYRMLPGIENAKERQEVLTEISRLDDDGLMKLYKEWKL